MELVLQELFSWWLVEISSIIGEPEKSLQIDESKVTRGKYRVIWSYVKECKHPATHWEPHLDQLSIQTCSLHTRT